MKNLLKRTCVLLLVFAMFMSMCSNVFATKLLDGNNGKEIYLSWSYYKKDGANKIPVTQLDSTDDTYYAKLSYSNNPTVSAEVMASFEFFCDVDKDIVTGITGENNFSRVQDVEYIFAGNVIDGRVFVTGAATNGFVQWSEETEKNESVESAGLFFVRFKVTKTVDADKLKTLFKVAVNENSFISDLNGKSFTIIELPHFAASVKDDAGDIYDSSNEATIKSKLNFTLINESGLSQDVSPELVEIEKGSVQNGKLTVTAKYGDYTYDLDIDVKADEREKLDVVGECTLGYTSGQTLNLTGLTVYEVWKSGNRNVVEPDAYETVPSKTTPLKVATHDQQPLKITYSGYEATVGTLTVSPADINGANIAAIEPQEYTGKQIKPALAVTYGTDNTPLVEGTDYTVTWGNNTTVAEGGSVTINGIGEYTSSKTVNFTITRATGELTLKVNGSTDPQSIKYRTTPSFADGDGNPLGRNSSDETKIQFKRSTDKDTAYTEFHYANHSALPVGEYSFRAVRAESANVGPATSNVVKVNITWKPITDWDINILIPDQTYTGSELTPDIRATIGEVTLEKDEDYTLSEYKFNLDVTSEGNLASVTVTGKGNYSGEKIVNFKINPRTVTVGEANFPSLGDVKSEYTYTGSPIKPEVTEEEITVTGGYELKVGRDYTVTYGENTNAGTGTITIAPVPGSNYTFNEFTKTFTINPVELDIRNYVGSNSEDVLGDLVYAPAGSDTEVPAGLNYTYNGNAHGVQLNFNNTRTWQVGDQMKNLNELVKITYDETSTKTATNASDTPYTVNATFTVNPAYTGNFVIKSGTDTYSYTWKINKANLQPTIGTAPTLNVLCDKLVETGTKQECPYDLSWLGATPKTIDVENVSNFEYTDLDKSNMSNIKFKGVTAKAENTDGSIKLKLTFDNYNDYELTIPVKYINKLSVSDKLSMEGVTVGYGTRYEDKLVLKLGEDTVTDKELYTITYYQGETPLTKAPTDAGTYTIKVTYEDDKEEGVYPGHIGETKATLTIEKRILSVLVEHAEITYGDPVPTDGYKVEFSGLIGMSELDKEYYTVGTEYTETSNAGEYKFTLTLKENEVTKNYSIAPEHVTGKLKVNKKSLQGATVILNDENQIIYDGSEKTPGVTVTVKLGNGTTPVLTSNDYTLEYKDNKNAGTATITITGKDTGNYTGKVEKTFMIEKATPTIAITGVKQDATYTGERFSNTYVQTNNNPSDLEVTYEYYLQSDTACTTQVKPIDAGSYKVRISFAGNDNYNAVEPTATVDFTIGRANHPISIAAASVTYTGAPYSETNITVTPTCEVTFTYYASETGNEPITRPTDVGTYWVVASYAGTDNYNSSTSARVSFSITKATPPTPAEVKVDGEDKTLKDLEDSMRKDLGAIGGEFTWRDSDGKELPSNTKIEANKEYEWTFTPTGEDAKNYFPISGKTTPYVRDDLSWLPGVLGGGSTFNFRDVTRYDYFYSAVKWAAENGIASGTSRYTFSPDTVCTRAQTVTFLWRAAGSPMPSYRISPFTDVNYGDYYYNAVLWAVEQGITTGLTATTFGPDKTVTRGQVATFLYRAASAVKPNITNPFTDVKSTAYNYDAILWAYDNRITTGTSTTTFSPDAFCTRAQIVTFLYRFYQGR